MPRCEDFPCCGHELGCCPSYDNTGRQLDMVCTCGAQLPVSNRYSICDTCLKNGWSEEEMWEHEDHYQEEEDYRRQEEEEGDL